MSATTSHKLRNALIGGGLTVGVVVLVFGFLIPKVADYSAVATTISKMDPRVFTLLVGATVLTIVTFWLINVASLPGLRFWPAAYVTQASYAVANTVPGGGPISLGLTYEMMKPYGFGGEDVALMMGVSGIWNIFGKFIVPVLAIVVLVAVGEATKDMATAAIIGVAALVVALGLMGAILWKESLARKVGNEVGVLTRFLLRPLHRTVHADIGGKFVEFRTQVIGVVRKRWAVLTLAAVANQLAYFIALVVCLRGAGISAHELHWTEIFAAFAFARLASAIPITPGAVGVAETAYIGLLVAAGGPNDKVVAAVLLFRAATYLAPIPVGGILYVFWRRSVARSNAAAAQPKGT